MEACRETYSRFQEESRRNNNRVRTYTTISYTLIEMSFKSDVKADSQTVFKRSQQAS